MDQNEQRWLRCRRTLSTGPRLVCFPHAGGSAAFFQAWADLLDGIEVHAVQYPGRADRIDDPFADDLVTMASSIAAEALTLDDRPLTFFGHSMGAAVALEAARSCAREGFPIQALIVSGTRDLPLPDRQVPDVVSDDDLVQSLVDMGGTDHELAENPLFRDLVLPYIRSDSDLFHRYETEIEASLACPITVIAGSADAVADRRPWSQLTTAPVRSVEVEGRHFYLVDRPPVDLLFDAVAGT